jgi:outer membrane protein assembly factor BamB
VARSRPLLQYDAGSTHGNSGGPVYRLDTGEVVGIVRWGLGDAGFLNLGVPVNQAKLLLQRAGVVPQVNVLDPSSPDCQVAPGDISLLNTIGLDKSLTSLLSSTVPFELAPRDPLEAYDQVMSNAGYLSCYGRLAPPVSAPALVGDRIVLTGNDGRVRVYDPLQPPGDQPTRPLFNVDNRFMFFPAVGREKQICFSAGTPSFALKEKVDTGMAILSILSAASGGRVYNATKLVPTIDAKGSVFAINANNGNLDWEYEVGFAACPTIAGDRVYFGSMGAYGCLDGASGREVWAAKEKLGGRATKWYTVAPGDQVLYVLMNPVRVETKQDFPGFAVLGDGEARLMAVLPKDGKVLWQAKVTDIGGQANPLASGLAVGPESGRVYVTRNSQAWAFSSTGKAVWAYGDKTKRDDRDKKRETKEISSLLTRFSDRLACDGKRVYVGGDDGKVYCLDAATGREIWTFVGLGVMGEATLIEGTLFCGSSNGWMYAIDPLTGMLKWKVDVRFPIVGRPLVHQGMLYFTSQTTNGFGGNLHAVYMPKSDRMQ